LQIFILIFKRTFQIILLTKYNISYEKSIIIEQHSKFETKKENNNNNNVLNKAVNDIREFVLKYLLLFLDFKKIENTIHLNSQIFQFHHIVSNIIMNIL
jgi:hypothetical protein